MLHVFYLDVAYILQWLFPSVFRCFYKCFRRMLQVFQLFRTILQNFYLDVLKVDRVLHLTPRLLLPRIGACSLLDAGDVRAAWVEQIVQVTRNPSERGGRHGAGAGHRELRPGAGLGPDIRALASPLNITQVRGK
jgi:hypothetical protein